MKRILAILYFFTAHVYSQNIIPVYVAQTSANKAVEVYFTSDKWSADVWVNVISGQNISSYPNAIVFTRTYTNKMVSFYPVSYNSGRAVKLYLFGINEQNTTEIPPKYRTAFKMLMSR